ncbi:protein hedgehog [Favolaschia claudopus]|uniref:Protein hedgehog n=1 Tax=Favolaschia claudopus TaxID=2862362 RepID=A0AAW0ELC7_9AGAR
MVPHQLREEACFSTTCFSNSATSTSSLAISRDVADFKPRDYQSINGRYGSVVIGSQKAGKRTLPEKFRLQFKFVEAYTSTLLGSTSLLTAESNVVSQIQQLTDILERGKTTDDIAGIVFVCGTSTSFPFTRNTSFLGRSESDLFQNLFVISAAPDAMKKRWDDLVQQGMQVITQEDYQNILHQLGDSRSLSSDSSAQCAVTPLSDGQDILRRAALSIKRHPEQAVILLVGQSGHGKSKTINRLIGQDLLRVGQISASALNIRKVIQRVKVNCPSKIGSASLTVVFDDTPGLDDTTYLDRKTNAALMQRYKEKYFSDIFPNVILLVAAWDSITPDAHNKVSHFTSPVGRSMYNLSLSGLVDSERPNVVVVITKSLSSWDQFDDYDNQRQKNGQWRIEAGLREGIVIDLQRKIFPSHSPWHIVFIENGGGRDMTAQFPILPNGVQSHQNLFDAITEIVGCDKPGCSDLIGMQALQVLAGAEPLGPSSKAEVQNLVEQSPEDIANEEAIETEPLEERIQQLTEEYLGNTYDFKRGTFGRKSVLKTVDLPVQFTAPQNQNNEFECAEKIVTQPAAPHSTEILKRPDTRLQTHYSSDPAFRSAISAQSQQYRLYHVIQIATVDPDRVELSAEMLRLIERLPAFSAQTEKQYMQFFSDYGTHVITRLVLGGVLRVILKSTDSAMSRRSTSASSNGARITSSSSKSALTRSMLVLRDGGGAVAPDLTRFLERNFSPDLNSTEWHSIRQRWITELEKDPVFCPDHPLTSCVPLYEARGIPSGIQAALKQAYQLYDKKVPATEKTGKTTESAGDSKPLPRRKNWFNVTKKLGEAMTQVRLLFGGGKGAFKHTPE